MKLSEVDQRTLHIKITPAFGRRPCNYHNIISTLEIFFVKPITFSQQTGYSMPDYTVPYLFAHRNTQPVLQKPVFSHIHHKISVCQGFSFPVIHLKIPVPFQ